MSSIPTGASPWSSKRMLTTRPRSSSGVDVMTRVWVMVDWMAAAVPTPTSRSADSGHPLGKAESRQEQAVADDGADEYGALGAEVSEDDQTEYGDDRADGGGGGQRAQKRRATREYVPREDRQQLPVRLGESHRHQP